MKVRKNSMKILKFPYIFIATLMSYNAYVYSMEAPRRFEYLHRSLVYIYDFVEDLSLATDINYQMLENKNKFFTCARALGLQPTDTLLDIQYHYLLFRKQLKQEKDQTCTEIIQYAYKCLLEMLLEVDLTEFKKEFQSMIHMSYADVEFLELEDVDPSEWLLFVKEKQILINKEIRFIKTYAEKQKSLGQSIYREQTIQVLLNLPKDASTEVIERAYKNYMQLNSADQWVAQQKIGKISLQDLKKKIAKIETIKRAYDEYVRRTKSFEENL